MHHLLLVVGLAVVAGYNPLGGDLCATLNNCNGHGFCNTHTKVCTCQVGWGAPTDISIWKAPDCSLRTCPSGLSWNSVPTSATTGHTVLAECSDMGLCNTNTGECNCFPGYQGLACELAGCPNACSGHGRCLSMRYLAGQTAALPLSPARTYYGLQTTTTWDQERIFGCVCDSSWSVGLASGQTQEPEWFGADCSLRRCPSNNDPLSGVTDTNCAGVAAVGSTSVGAAGNLCHIECSNRGICNYKDGTCACFEGFLGVDCSVQVAG